MENSEWEERWGNKRTALIEITGNEDDIDSLVAMLRFWQGCGGVGHSTSVSFSMDGDGPSHPKFKVDGKPIKEFKNKYWKVTEENYKTRFKRIEET